MSFSITPVASAMEHIREPEDFIGDKMREFVMLVAEAFPGCKFARTGSHTEVFYPEDVYCMGRIYTAGDKYGVASRTISAPRKPYKKETVDIRKAVKLAKQYLRRLPPAETITVQAGVAARIIYKDRKEPTDAFSTVMRSLTRFDERRSEPRIITELRALRAANYGFVTFGFANEVDEALRLYDEHKNVKDEYDGFGVWVHEVGGQTVIDVGHIPNMHYSYQACVVGDPLRYTSEDLPETISGKIALLSMLNVGGSVAGVGVRVAQDLYYFEATA